MAGGLFAAGAAISLLTSEELVRRIERVAERTGLSDALLGGLAALAADSPEITSAVTAIVHHQHDVGAGVVLGSAVFNLSALLGLGAVATRGVLMGKRVIAFGGAVTVGLTVLALLTVAARTPAPVTTAIGVALLGGYLALLGAAPAVLRRFRRFSWCQPLANWIAGAVAEEELAEEEEIEPERRSVSHEAAAARRDILVGIAALVVVVGASYLMERSVTSLGSRIGMPGIVTGALVLGAVTGIPNAVASLYLARKGNGTAALSTALNSNNFNLLIGLLIPAVVAGIGAPLVATVVAAWWCLGLTVVSLAAAYRSGGLARGYGVGVLLAYAGFIGAVVGTGLG